jgi:bifunctional DNase/RNase
VLWNRKTRTKLSFYIGILEAAAIATELEQIQFAHPMTHDLIKKLMNHLGVRVKGVELCDLQNDIYYNWIHLDVRGKETKIDSRTSDALAIALRMKAPIYVNERVLDKLKERKTGAKPEIQNKESSKWTEMLQNMKPEDFGRYKM